MPELGARLTGLLDQERVETATLGHDHERLHSATHEPATKPEPELEDVHLLLDDRRDREREQAKGAVGQAATTGLVPRKARLVHE